ncbi:LTA synthase family protein [Arachidicoccus terrestris]|uniref:LTA synthase family protein n=1 Tax=Arachidicoccus terrestris TaxID=2875539 RepID=UPI001CC535A8|nr:alkaline phosphatase family protein [Arachidicoccus terrestris]UAY55304.1 sulfatase-like hydrolase/transferase [Arachidicoccus terrestris]
MRAYLKYGKPFAYLCGFYLVVNTALRLLLLADHQMRATFHFTDYFRVLLPGLFPNLLVFFMLAMPLWLYLLFLSDGKLKKPYGQIILGLLILLLGYVLLSNNIIKAYGSVLINIVVIFLSIKLLLTAWMVGAPRYRLQTRKWLFGFTLFLYVAAILLNALSEYFFFKEFGVRYNFIAVDYLIYTNEVIGNIMQSYPVVPLFSVLALVAIAITVFIYRRTTDYFAPLPDLKTKLLLIIAAAVSILVASRLLPFYAGENTGDNIYVSELGADGLYKFYTAFQDNGLSYTKFYPEIEQQKAVTFLARQLGWTPSPDHQTGFEKKVTDTAGESHKNIVLISVESLSADYLAHYGNKHHLTPFLDSLADQSLMFTRLYAAGNRTVRGLEALTLCIPPSPGESIIKRKDNKNKFTTGGILRQKGYTVQFLYGGYSYFDNMQDFFEGNGYQVIDRNNFQASEISFANIWGVCDEDMAGKMIQVLDKDHGTGRPFFAHWMTVSNHRPFTYPNGKIAIPGDARSRNGGVMYTDYALRRFFQMARRRPWFNNTVFIIVADHCASSAGKVALPLDKYRIPCLVYSPGFIPARKVNTLMSQIDIMPTVFGLLHFSYRSKFIGEDIFKQSYRPRALMATYQDMGYLQDSVLTVLSPVRQIKSYRIRPAKSTATIPGDFISKFDELPVSPRDSLKDAAISYYQMTAWLLDKRKYQE